MLSGERSLSDLDLAAVADLERRVVAHDGGRLKLEWGTLRSRPGDQIDDLLWRDGEQVVGFLGLYSFGGPSLELAGMVDPAVRRTGIGSAMLAAAVEFATSRSQSRALLVTPRSTAAGAAFAAAHNAILDHSEHHMVLGTTPSAVVNPSVTIRPATVADSKDVVRVLEAGFGEGHGGIVIEDATDAERTLVVEAAGEVVGTVRLTHHEAAGGIYGLAVDPSMQGQGIGRQILTECCRLLRAAGATTVTLEVEVANDRALGLYESVGFQCVSTEDYWAITF